jgi:hypothetical protein
MAIQKITLVVIAALLVSASAYAQVSINPTIVNPPKVIPRDPKVPFIAADPLQEMHRKRMLPSQPQLPLEFQQLYLPPAQYDHRYDGVLTVLRTIPSMIMRECTHQPNRFPIGCAQVRDGKCLIWILTDEELEKIGWNFDTVYRHEIAHCNG